MNWMQTYTGKKFYPADADPGDIDIKDISHALAHICRFNGHVKTYYSVAQHCCIVSNNLGTNPKLRMAGLLHDAAEAYICDLPAPIKRENELAGYRTLEKRLQSKINKAFDVEFEAVKYADIITHADTRALATEKRDIIAHKELDWGIEKFSPFFDTIIPLEPKMAKIEFENTFDEIITEIHLLNQSGL